MVMIILGISLGTRILGLGVIRNGELVEWQVKCFKGSWSNDKLSSIIGNIQSLCDHFKISDMALKVVSPLRSSKNLLTLTKEIIEITEKDKIRLSKFTTQDLKLRAGPREKHSMNDLLEFVMEKYPVLKREYIKERNNLNPYYLKMFEAIAAAHIAGRKD